MRSVRAGAVVLVVVGSILVGIGTAVGQSAWPVFQQNAQHTGTSSLEGAGIPAIEWVNADIPGGIWGSPVIDSEGYILVTTNGDTDQLVALDPETGAVGWAADLGGWSDSTAAVAPDGTIYVGGSSGSLYSFAPGGVPRWAASLGSPVHGRPTLDSSGNVYVHTETSEILSLQDTGTGVATNWLYAFGTTESSWRTALTLNDDESLVYYKRESTDDSRLVALRTADGTLAWEDADGADAWNIAGVCAGGVLYQGFQNDGDGGGSLIRACDAAVGTPLWQYQPGIGSGFWGSDSGALTPDGSVLYVTWRGGGGLIALDTATGAELWKVWEGGADGQLGDFFATPCVDSLGTAFVADHNGTAAAYRPDGMELWRIENPGGMTESWSSPAVAPDNSIYLAGYRADPGGNGNLGVVVKFSGEYPPEPVVVFETDFDTGYAPGEVAGQDEWAVVTGASGDAVVQTGMSVTGAALRLAGGADLVVERPIPNYAVLGFTRVTVEYDVRFDGASPYACGLNLVDSEVGPAVDTAWKGADGPTIDLPMDQQIDVGMGEAITNHTEFLDEDGDGFCRSYMAEGWNVGVPSIDLEIAGIGVSDLSNPGMYLRFDCRYFQEDVYDGETLVRAAYGDAPIGFYFKDVVGKNYGMGWLYQVSLGDAPHPTWTTITAPLDFGAAGDWPYDADFDPATVNRVRFMQTNWGGTTGNDFTDVRNVRISPGVYAELDADQGGDGTDDTIIPATPTCVQEDWYRVRQVFDFGQHRLLALTVDGAGPDEINDIFFRHDGDGAVADGANRLRIRLLENGGDDAVTIDNIRIIAEPGFAVTSVQRTAGPEVTVEWRYMGSEAYYVVERSDDGPDGTFTDISGVVAVATRFDDPAPAGPDAVYRVGQYLEPPRTVLYTEDFEGGAVGWTHGGVNDSWGLGSPVDYTGTNGAPASAVSGSACVGTNIAGDYNQDEESWLQSPVIDLTGRLEADLSFQEWLITENGDWEPARVELWDADTSTPIATVIADRWGDHRPWTEQTVSLEEGVDRRIVLRFIFASDDSIEFPGWYLDDVTVTTIP